MRLHGRAEISQSRPRALGVCDRCGFLWNLDRLAWQWDWQQGPRLTNLRILVCPTCYDVPQESGRTIVLPPDPIPVANARPEDYVAADNPVSPLGFSPTDLFSQTGVSSLSANFGNMTLNGGLDAAFDGITNRRRAACAALSISVSSFQNFIGKNWNAFPSGINLTTPSTVAALTHIVASFTLVAPSDAAFLNARATGFQLQGSTDNITYVTIYQSTTAGTVGESLTATTTSVTPYQYHRIAFQGDGINTIAVAQVQINIADQAPNDI